MLHNISIIDGRGVYKVTQVTSLCHLHSLCKFHNIKSYIKLFPMAITPKTSAKGHISHYILSFFPNNLFLYLFLFCLLYAYFLYSVHSMQCCVSESMCLLRIRIRILKKLGLQYFFYHRYTYIYIYLTILLGRTEIWFLGLDPNKVF